MFIARWVQHKEFILVYLPLTIQRQRKDLLKYNNILERRIRATNKINHFKLVCMNLFPAPSMRCQTAGDGWQGVKSRFVAEDQID